ncbi:MAG: glycoside hydrolase family 10 protein, partial [Telluria sp.]
MKKLIFAVAALCVATASYAQAIPPKREMRGVWISTDLSLDWPNRLHTPAQQRTALTAILDHNKATGMNAAFVQVRSQSDAMYPSALEPWSYYLTNQQGAAPNPAWDPLQFAIDESRKRGLEFHAWINPYRAVATLANAGNNAQYAATHVSRTHPEWMLTIGTVQILNPGLPAVRDVGEIRRFAIGHLSQQRRPGGRLADIFGRAPALQRDVRRFAQMAAI